MPTNRFRQLLAVGAILLAGSLGVSACGSTSAATSAAPSTSTAAAEVTVTHAQGTTAVPSSPQTVITFDLATLDTLDALGVQVAGLPKASVPSYLSEYEADTFLDVGTLFEPNYEAVAAAQPDLIIVANRSAEALPELAKIAPTIDLSLEWTDYATSLQTNVRTLGEIFGKQAAAEAALAEIDGRITTTRQAAAAAGTGLIVLTSGGEITAFGPGSRFGWIHDQLGLTPAIQDVEAATHGDPVSNEFILQTDPDWLLVVDRDAATGEGTAAAEQILGNEVVAQTKAWSSGQVIYLDPEPWYIVMSGLTAANIMLDQMAELKAS